ncbi:BTB/POZ domain-containing protein 1-like [Ruditapes philippinarum]|uniref:BTB/POZ domain-containing protein 1-like n=1 Tax=Ruditapes philippinarum TaxID=129788 RepID=UPI00295BC9D0|nr:BTB/POZ domain-containing protein 1-like [Ruditapes philippinarum]
MIIKMERGITADDSETLQTTEQEVSESSNRKKVGTLKDDASNFCLSDRLSDVSFVFKESSTKLPAHRLLLSMRSKVFEAMFYGPMAETSGTILIKDTDISTMKIILRFIYSDEVELDGKNVTGCLYVAKKYALDGLVAKCTEFLANTIAVGTACTIYEQAKVYDEISLQTKCFDYIVEHSNDIFLSADFLTLSYDSLLEIMASDCLSSDESLNFMALKRWAGSECVKQDLTTTPKNIRSCLGEIVFLVRFPLMSIDVFAKAVAPTGILTYEEMLMIYHHLATKTGSPEQEHIGRFSSKTRQIVVRFDRVNQSPGSSDCLVVLNTSKPVQLLSVKGKFVIHVSSIHLTNTGRHRSDKILFNVHDDTLDLLEPLTLKPENGTIHIEFQARSGVYDDSSRSTSVNISRTIRDVIINVKRIPYGLQTLVFKEI